MAVGRVIPSESNPYVETDTVAPLNIYGCSKVLAEKLVLQAHPA
ncbi:sugar nucleotide-binding protein [Nostoc sp.]